MRGEAAGWLGRGSRRTEGWERKVSALRGARGRKRARGTATLSRHGAGSCHAGERQQPNKLQKPKRREHGGRREVTSPEVSQAREKTHKYKQLERSTSVMFVTLSEQESIWEKSQPCLPGSYIFFLFKQCMTSISIAVCCLCWHVGVYF